MEKICSICGDKALGYNFNALTCESCKAFFRRNALRNKNYRCPTGGQCILNPKTRKYCRRCRLNKCFLVGMKKEWIQTDQDKKLNRRKHRRHHRNHFHLSSTTNDEKTIKYDENLVEDVGRTSPKPSKQDASSLTSQQCESDEEKHQHQANFNQHNNEKNRTNIIILPIIPMSLITKSATRTSKNRTPSLSSTETGHQQEQPQDNTNHRHDIIKSLNKNDIIKYINQQIQVSFPLSTSKTSEPTKLNSKPEHQVQTTQQQNTIQNDIENRIKNNENNGNNGLTITHVEPSNDNGNNLLQNEKTTTKNNDYDYLTKQESRIENFCCSSLSNECGINNKNKNQDSFMFNFNDHHQLKQENKTNPSNTNITYYENGCPCFQCQCSSSMNIHNNNSNTSNTIDDHNNNNHPQQQQSSTNLVLNELHNYHNQHQLVNNISAINSQQNPSSSSCSSSMIFDNVHGKCHEMSPLLVDEMLTSSTSSSTPLTPSTTTTTSNSNYYNPNNNRKDDNVEANLNDKIVSNKLTTKSNCHKKTDNNNNNGYLWHISDNVYRAVLQVEFTSNPLNPEHDTEVNKDVNMITNQLNHAEQERLNEVNAKFQPLYDMPSKVKNISVINNIEDCLRYFEIAMKQLIIIVKNLPSFRKMCQEDQIVMLKGSAGEIKTIINMRFLGLSHHEKYFVPHPNEHSQLLVFEQEYLIQTYGIELWTRTKNFILSFRQDWRDDESILNLLALILLFYPNRSNLIHKEYIMVEYLTYCHLLQRYLQVKYHSVCEAKTIYLNLLSRLEELHYLNEECWELLLNFDLKDVGPLTLELCENKIKKFEQKRLQQQQQQKQTKV